MSLDRLVPFEHDLTEPVSAGRAVVWRSTEPRVVLGAGQRGFAGTVTRLPVACRRSGGGAVLVGPWLVNVAVVIPVGRLDIREASDWLGRVHIEALAELGIDAVPAAERSDAVPWACFGGVARGELLALGRKLTGFAQERRRTGVALVAGTLVTPPDWALLCEAMGRPHDAPLLAAATISCADLGTDPPSAEAVASAVAHRLRVEVSKFARS